MRTTINLADDLMEELMRLTQEKTKTKAINRALEEFIQRKRIERLLALRGKLHLENNWQRLREMELDES